MRKWKNAGCVSLALLLDTHVLVWAGNGDRRLKPHLRDVIADPETSLLISAVTAWEFTDLELRRRLPLNVSFGEIVDMLTAQVVDFPAGAWEIARKLPMHHLDPVDRMTVAHALYADVTLITGDKKMRAYPVKTLW